MQINAIKYQFIKYVLCLFFPADNKPSSHNAHNSAMVRWLKGVPVDEKTIEIVSGNMEKYITLATSFDC